MIVHKFSHVLPLLRQKVSRTLDKHGIYTTPDALTEYCKYCFSDESHRFLALEHKEPASAIGFNPLKWDSNIYDLAIGNFDVLSMSPNLTLAARPRWTVEMVQEATMYAFDHKIDMLFTRVQLTDLVWIQALEQAGFKLMDIQCPMVLQNLSLEHVRTIKRQFDTTVRDVSSEDVPAIISFGKCAFGYSHLYADPLLPKMQSDKLHETWLRNDCNGRADFVLVAEANDRVFGFIAGLWNDSYEKIFGIGHGHIDLIAVAEDMRGRGIGSQLIAACMQRFLIRGASLVTVSSQATNLGAIRLYQGCGFEFSGFEVTMHAWRLGVGEQA